MGPVLSIINRRAAASAITSLCLVLAALPLQAASPLSLEEALGIAQANAPALNAAAHGAQASKHMAIAASQLPDPVLRAGVDNLPVTGPERLSLGRDFMTMRRIGVMQEYVSPGKRQLIRERNELEASRLDASGRKLMAGLRRDVAIAWLDRFYAAKSRELLKTLAAELELQLQTLDSQLRAGKATAVESPMASAVLLQTRDRMLVADKQERLANIVLARWLGEEANRTPGTPPNIEELPLDLTNSNLVSAAPSVLEHSRELDIARTELAIAEKNKWPNWSWEVAWQQRGSAYSNMVSVGISVPLPLNASNRQDREIAAKRSQLEQALELHEDLRREVQAGVAASHAEWQSLIERRKRLAGALLPLARQRIDLSLASYRSGQASLASVLEARRAEVETHLQLLDLERETARLWAQLQYVYLETVKAGAPGAQP